MSGDISEHFNRSEFACHCDCGLDTVDVELITVLETLRDYFNAPVIINSGIRCREHNAAVGGSQKSRHLIGKAADFVIDGIVADEVATALEKMYHTKYGIGRYDGRTHIDVRALKARWDKRA